MPIGGANISIRFESRPLLVWLVLTGLRSLLGELVEGVVYSCGGFDVCDDRVPRTLMEEDERGWESCRADDDAGALLLH